MTGFIQYIAFSDWYHLLTIVVVFHKVIAHFFFFDENIPLHICASFFIHSTYAKVSWLVLGFGDYKQSYTHSHADICVTISFQINWVNI